MLVFPSLGSQAEATQNRPRDSGCPWNNTLYPENPNRSIYFSQLYLTLPSPSPGRETTSKASKAVLQAERAISPVSLSGAGAHFSRTLREVRIPVTNLDGELPRRSLLYPAGNHSTTARQMLSMCGAGAPPAAFDLARVERTLLSVALDVD